MTSRPFETVFGGEAASFIDLNWGNWGDSLDSKDRAHASIPTVFSPFPCASSSTPPVPAVSDLPVQPVPFAFNTPARSTSASPSRLSNPQSSKASIPPTRFSAVSSRSSIAPVVVEAKELPVERRSIPEVKGEGDGGEAGRPQTPKAVKIDPAKLQFTPKVASFTAGKLGTKFQPGSALKLRSSIPLNDKPPINRTEKPPIPATPLPSNATDNPGTLADPLLKRKMESALQTGEKRLKLAENEKGNEENCRSEGKIVAPQWLEEAVRYIEQRNSAWEASRPLPKPQTVYSAPLEVTERRKRQNIAITQLQLEAETLYCELLTMLQDFNEDELLEDALLALSLA